MPVDDWYENDPELDCEHDKRTAKCVWFEHAMRPEHYPAARCKIHDCGEVEVANFRRWYISSSQYDTSCDMQFA